MGKFGNTPAEMAAATRQTYEALGEEMPQHVVDSLAVGTVIGPVGMARKPWHGQSGFEAMGCKVPAFRKTAGEATLKLMGVDGEPGDAEKRYDIVARMSQCIERDNSHEALELCMRAGIDATGCYRMLAVLLCEAEPAPEEPAPATYIDLVAA